MQHAVHQVTGFSYADGHSLEVVFEDGFRRVIDFLPVLIGSVYGPLQDPALFQQVQLDDEVKTLVWPTGGDFDPETLYNWPVYLDALKAMVRGEVLAPAD